MYIYYYDNGWIIKDYDPETQGLRRVHNSILLYNGSMVLNSDQLVNTLRDAVNGCNGNGRFTSPVIYKGLNINTMIRDIFISYDPITQEYYSNYHYDDTLLKQFEAV